MLTSRKVAGSIPDDAIGIFHSHNPSMALGLTQVTEIGKKKVKVSRDRPNWTKGFRIG